MIYPMEDEVGEKREEKKNNKEKFQNANLPRGTTLT